MRESGFDVLIVLYPESIHYICGFDAAWMAPFAEFSGGIIPVEGDPSLMTRSLESKAAKEQAIKDFRVYMDWKGPWKLLKEIVEKAKATRGTIGVEENVITVKKFNQLKGAFPDARILNSGGLLEGVMAEPSKLEMEFTRKAGEITQAGFERAIETIKEGIPLYRVLNRANEAMYEAGMTEQRIGGYTMAVGWAGPDGGAMHETDVTRKIQKGDIVSEGGISVEKTSGEVTISGSGKGNVFTFNHLVLCIVLTTASTQGIVEILKFILSH